MGIKLTQFESTARLPKDIVPISPGTSPVGAAYTRLGNYVIKRAIQFQKERDVLDATRAMSAFQDENRKFIIDEKIKLGSEATGSHYRGNEFYKRTNTIYSKNLSH